MPMQDNSILDEMICISRRDFSESSLLLYLFSWHYGIIPAIARGARRKVRNVAKGIDFFDVIKASCNIKKEGISLLLDYKEVHFFPAIREDLDKWFSCFYIAELIQIGLKEYEPAEALYKVLKSSLYRIDKARDKSQLVRVFLGSVLKIIGLLGYRPILDRCSICKRRPSGKKLFLSASAGGLVCRDCEMFVFDKIEIASSGWLYLIGKRDDLQSAFSGFEMLSFLIREFLGKSPSVEVGCKERLFGFTRM